jgi:hypothetical protein
LTTPERDPRSAEPNLKQCAVRIEARTDEATQGAAEPDEDPAVSEVAE